MNKLPPHVPEDRRKESGKHKDGFERRGQLEPTAIGEDTLLEKALRKKK